ncbi:MAG: type III-B CRISPR module-associated protein Cmr5 [Polyangiaceae bacterium]|nr:type III-B CRISPR module-associated protein Cmr5 [Polyangiaceae bacterium]
MSDRTLEQRRAGHALDCVEAVRGERLAGRYRTYAESLPAHIVMGGLGQAVATELAAARGGESENSRDEKQQAHERLVRDLESWLAQSAYKHIPAAEKKAKNWLLRTIVAHDQEHYLQAQAEALAWLVWLKKFCQASLPRTAED